MVQALRDAYGNLYYECTPCRRHFYHLPAFELHMAMHNDSSFRARSVDAPSLDQPAIDDLSSNADDSTSNSEE